jgi:cytoskeletal protein RodZ
LSDKRAEAVSAPVLPKPKANSESASLGGYLAKVREGRGCSMDEAVAGTPIPKHYLRMIESNDYSAISDQLYVLPFLRRYALFLALDPEEVAMRFVREVQRADNAPLTRAIEPIAMDRAASRTWSRPALLAGGLIAVMIVAWVVQARHHRGAGRSSAGAITEQSSASH